MTNHHVPILFHIPIIYREGWRNGTVPDTCSGLTRSQFQWKPTCFLLTHFITSPRRTSWRYLKANYDFICLYPYHCVRYIGFKTEWLAVSHDVIRTQLQRIKVNSIQNRKENIFISVFILRVSSLSTTLCIQGLTLKFHEVKNCTFSFDRICSSRHDFPHYFIVGTSILQPYIQQNTR